MGLEPRRFDRRELLEKGGRAALVVAAAALVGSTAGCASSGGPSAVAPKKSTTTTRGTTPKERTWSDLEESITGHLVRPGDHHYGEARLVYNLRYASLRPAAIAYCATPGDVSSCLSFAREHDLAAIPRSGGHSFAGYSSGPGLVIDTTRMHTVSFEAGGRRARVGSGTRLVDLYAACASRGVLVPGGSCPTVGIAGLTLGGGAGVLGRKYGLTCDNPTSLDIVSAEGTLLRCSEDSHPELFWACRGGGGRNFGIVTSFTFATHPIPELTLFTFDWSWTQARSVLGAWLEWIDGAPDELWSNCQLASEGSSGLAVRCSGVYTGAKARLEAALAPFLDGTGPPSYAFVGTSPYLQAMLVEAGCDGLDVGQCHLSGQSPAGTLDRALFVAKSAYLARPLPQGGIDAALSSLEAAQSDHPGEGAALIFDAYGGRINEIASNATAFIHRDALCGLEISMAFSPDAPEEVVLASAWPAATASSLAPFCNGESYQNYIDPTLEGWVDAYYGANARRLSAVKAAYDPDSVFSFPQAVPL